MNQIETKIIVMVTNRLSAARDSEAKNELIEELSENLYQRYQDLTAEGLPEEEALQQAMENLGDVGELIAYLKSVDGDINGGEEYGPENTDREEEEGRERNGSSRKKGSFFGKDLESGLEDMVNAAVSVAKTATDFARDATRNVSEQFKERYPDGFSWQSGSSRSEHVERIVFPSEGLHTLDVRLSNADVAVCFIDDPNAPAEVEADTEYIKTEIRDNGVLEVCQESTASTSALFNLGVMTSSKVEICLPKRMWDSVSLTTVSGDVSVFEGLDCRRLQLQSKSGDLEICEAAAETIHFRSASGDITGKRLRGDVQAETKSGDVELDGDLGICAAASISGEVEFTGNCVQIDCGSVSGDVKIRLEALAERVKASSTSGDCKVSVPGESGFRLSYQTTSGDFSTNLSMAGVYRRKKSELCYLDGGSSTIQISSVSGDLEVNGR